jgi:hypothetical protein
MTKIKIQLRIKKQIPTEGKIVFLDYKLFTELRHKKLITQKREFFETCEDKPSWVLNIRAALEAGYTISDEIDTMVSKSKKFTGKYVFAKTDWKQSGKQKYCDSIGELEAFVASGAFEEV